MKRFIKSLSICAALSLGLNAQLIHLENGWNNIGLTDPIALSSLNNPNIEYVWKYNSQDGKWYFYSNKEEYMNTVRQWINEGRNYDFLHNLNSGDAIWIKSNSRSDINLSAIYTEVKGFVKDALTNEPINNFKVIIDGLEEKVFTDTNGTFEISNIIVDNHTLTIIADGYLSTTIPLNIENANPIDLGQIELVPQNANHPVEVKGNILDAVTGDQITVPVRLRLFEGYNNTSGNPIIDITVNNGEYDITNLEAGSYTVVLDANGYNQAVYNYTFASNNDNNIIRQDLVLSPIDANVDYVMRATLTWGEYPTDLDSHLLAYAPDSNHSVWHIYYGNKETYEGDKKVADLDTDDTDSFGPEHITLYDLNTSMKYVYYVWRYSDDGELKNSNAEVKVYYQNHLYDFKVPYEDGRGWKVFEIINGVLTPCQTNCMVPDDVTNDEFESWKINPINPVIKELLDTANSPK